MNPAKTETLQLPGTSLYYKVNGSGPVLLLLLGGAADADGADGLAGLLAQHFTVVSYDRRGLSRSKIADPAALLRLETHGDDASSLLASLTTEPALVFGSSIGAVIGLDLAIRHPERVGTLVAHEPPTPELLPDTERASFVRSQEEVEEVFRRDGMPAAMKKFVELAGVSYADREPDAPLPQPSPQTAANAQFFLSHDAKAVRRYHLDAGALTTTATRIIPAAGSASGETWPRHCAVALAKRSGARLEEFPGGHVGYVSHPKAFAAKLIDVLQARAR